MSLGIDKIIAIKPFKKKLAGWSNPPNSRVNKKNQTIKLNILKLKITALVLKKTP